MTVPLKISFQRRRHVIFGDIPFTRTVSLWLHLISRILRSRCTPQQEKKICGRFEIQGGTSVRSNDFAQRPSEIHCYFKYLCEKCIKKDVTKNYFKCELIFIDSAHKRA